MGTIPRAGISAEERETQLRKQREREARWWQARTPFVHPSARRRQRALLAYIAEFFPTEGMTVGRIHCPPLTPDMRVLLKRKFLVMTRAPVYETMRLPLSNRLRVTAAGLAALEVANVTERDKRYLRQAIATGVVQ